MTRIRGFNATAARQIVRPDLVAELELPATELIIRGDCLDVLPTLTDRPRLIFADPPYNQAIDYGDGKAADSLPRDEYRRWLAEWIVACADALADDGSLWVLTSHEHQAAAFTAMETAGLHWRNTITWHERFGVHCTGKFSRTSRPIHYFARHPSRFVFNADAVRVTSARQQAGDKRANPAGKVMDDVWAIPRVCGTHAERIPGFPTQLPLELLHRIVAVASDPGDLVLDPFSGSATTGAAAIAGGRRYIGIEHNPNYCEVSRRRLSQHDWSSQ